MSADGRAQPERTAQELTTEIGRLLLSVLPAGAERLEYVIRALARMTQATAQVTMEDGSTKWVEPPAGAAELATELRAAMYRPGAGTWFSATFVVHSRGSLDADFNFDRAPQWLRPIPPDLYAVDLERFPRSSDAIPPWLREYVM